MSQHKPAVISLLALQLQRQVESIMKRLFNVTAAVLVLGSFLDSGNMQASIQLSTLHNETDRVIWPQPEEACMV